MKITTKLHLGAAALAAMIGLCGRNAQAQTSAIPLQMTYQAYVTDGSTPPVPLGDSAPTNHVVEFRIYNSPTSTDVADVIWAERQVVTVFKGNFSVLLGNGQPISTSNSEEPHPDLDQVFTDAMRYMGITVTDGGTTAEFTPRQRILPNAYAYRAGVAEVAENVSNQLYVDTSGNIGIGTDAPSAPLTIREDGTSGKGQLVLIDPNTASSNAAASGVLSAFGSDIASETTGRLWALGNLNSSDKDVSLLNDVSGGEVNLGTSASSTQLVLESDGDVSIDGTSFHIDAANNRVGIGTLTPNFTLDVDGNVGVKNDVTVLGSVTAGSVAVDTNTLVVDATNNRVGIGTSTPGRTFVVDGDGSVLGNLTADTLNVDTDTLSVYSAPVHRVGIGTNQPGKTLDVVGDGRVSGSLTAGSLTAGSLTVDTDTLYVSAANDRVGINTDTPQVPLHVTSWGGVANLTGTGNYMRFDHGGGVGTQDFNAGFILNVVGFFEGDLVASQAVASMTSHGWSDARAKEVLGLSNGEEDLGKLGQIRVTDYRWIDRTQDKGRVHKKVIAQEVEKVLPSAVSQMRRVVPSVYEKTEVVVYDAARQQLTLTVSKPHEFTVGDRVDVYTDEADLKETPVLAVASPTRFTIACEQEPKGAFVYGKWVDDYRMVDYDAIAMLNVSATQELHRKVQEQETEIGQLRAASAEKETEIASLKQRLNKLEALGGRLARIEAALEAGEGTPVSTVAQAAPAGPAN